MFRKVTLMLLVAVACVGCAEMSQVMGSGNGSASGSNSSLMAAAIKTSLELGSTRAADLLSQRGGYSQNALYRIELPQQVQPITTRLKQFGLGGQIERVEALMNQGAEQAASEAKAIFVDAVRAMSIADALGIVRGHETAATDYFRGQTENSLRQRYLPIIQRNLQQLGFYQQYQQLLSAYKQLPLANKPDLDLEQHVLRQSLDALFKQIGEEEKAIRQDPVGRGSAAIATVFGMQ